MKLWEFVKSPTGQLALVGILGLVLAGVLAWQRASPAKPLPAASAAARPARIPKIQHRETKPLALPERAPATSETIASVPTIPPLTLRAPTVTQPIAINLPMGRMIPAETVFALESGSPQTPLVALVTDDVWYAGQLLIPRGAELHGQVQLDVDRERLIASGNWTLLAPDGRTVTVSGSILAHDPAGTTGLSGTVLRTGTARAARLFAATFLSTATAALQDTRSYTGAFGESVVPIASVRNATLAGTSAVLRDYADQVRTAVARDGIYLRVPGGTRFYLYTATTVSIPLPASL